MRRDHRSRIDRRSLLGGAGSAIALATLGGRPRAKAALDETVSVLCPLPPDPAPPGVANFGEDELFSWEAEHDAVLNYDAVAWSNIRGKTASNFNANTHVHDVVYMSGSIPEFVDHLTPLEQKLSPSVLADMPASAANSVSWNGHQYGATSTLSLLTLYYNVAHFETAGISSPPTTWDQLKATAAELTRDGRFGWRINLAAPAGIGGAASYWMVFLQQAGGTMYDDNGAPIFDDAPGVDAIATADRF